MKKPLRRRLGHYDEIHEAMTPALSPTSSLLQNFYARMVLARTVDDSVRTLCERHHIGFVASCRGHEAAQVGSAVCIEVGKDFTLPYYRDLGVVLTIGMTPYEVFRTYLQRQQGGPRGSMLHWGYHKHNMITGTVPVATQILHAAGIAFASKLRREPVVTVAYCGDGAIVEPDFLEGIRFAALHRLPAVFICEQACTHTPALPAETGRDVFPVPSCTCGISLPEHLTHQRVDGTDVLAVYATMQAAMQQAREGRGPILLEMSVTRPATGDQQGQREAMSMPRDPLTHCQARLQALGAWDDAWAADLTARIVGEVTQALQDALRDTPDLDG